MSERGQLVSSIKEMAEAGSTQREICESLGISRWALRTIAEENWINIDNRSRQWAKGNRYGVFAN